jgi:hypothetical protein
VEIELDLFIYFLVLVLLFFVFLHAKFHPPFETHGAIVARCAIFVDLFRPAARLTYHLLDLLVSIARIVSPHPNLGDEGT